jgi:hypothetical protein
MINTGEEMGGKPLMWLQKKSEREGDRKDMIETGEEKREKS